MNLFIDSSTNRLVLSIFSDDLSLIKFNYVITNKNMTDIMVEQINNTLIENNLTIFDIKKIFVVNGPGSFTGIKLNSIFSNTYKILNDNVELYYIDACTIQCNKSNCLSIIDAKGNKFYCKLFINNKSSNIILLDKKTIYDFAKKYNLDVIDNIENYDLEECLKFNINKFYKTERIKPNYVKGPL